MARQVQIIKGTTAQNEAFTGAEGALSYDSQKKNLHVHDGATEGGFEIPSSAMADYVIYWDSGDASDHSHAKPGVTTPASGTWYRIYKSGWVEQGGYVSASGDSEVSTTYPIELQDPVCPDVNLVYEFQTDIFVKIQQVVSMTTTGFTTRGKAVNATSKVWENGNFYWKVFGKSIQGV